MKMLLAVAVGGAIGAVARYKMVGWVGHVTGGGFPWGTMAVNVLGSFLMGALIEVATLRQGLTPELRGFLAVWVLGAFTTFSSFALDVATLWERGDAAPAAAYIAASTALSILALFAGLWSLRQVLT